ncbi:RNA dependent RNA polymerase [viral metagenome]
MSLMNLPRDLERALKSGCRNLTEAMEATERAGQLGGPRSGLIFAAKCFDIPIQYSGDCAIEDVIEMLYDIGVTDTCSDVNIDALAKKKVKFMGERKRAGPGVFGQLVRSYHDKLSKNDRLPSEQHILGTSRAYSVGTWWQGQHPKDVFLVKRSAKVIKVNLNFSDVWRDTCDYYPKLACVIGKNTALLAGMTNDEATSWVIWLCATHHLLGAAGFAILHAYGRDAKFLKALNTYVKALGLNGRKWGRALCELTTLAGRGVGGLDMWDDIRTRVRLADFKREKAAECDMQRLRECVKSVLRDELRVKPTWTSREEYWTRRWLYTKAGSHPRFAEKYYEETPGDMPPQATRREFAESIRENLVASGSPRVDAGFSEKEEHGKTRAIYGCDTRSYYTFDYLLRPIEAAWRNSRVLLDPGRVMQSTRYESLKDKPGCRYMLDFDDFNSQHTIEAMKMVIEEACGDAPDDVLEWCVASWDNMYVHWTTPSGVREAKMVGTLPSGHRATTFINTVLNAAYCRYASGDGMSSLDSYHCGDDVIVFGRTSDITDYVRDVMRSPFRINASKQSVGAVCGEFLRVAFNDKEAGGYVARGVCSVVSGNWVTPTLLDKKSYVETLIRGAWTIASRSESYNVGLLAQRSLERRVPEVKGIARRLLTHEVSWNGTPVRAVAIGVPIAIVRPRGGRAIYEEERLGAYHASRDFMENHIDFQMISATEYEPADVYRMLCKASSKPRNIVGEDALTWQHEHSNRYYSVSMSHLCSLDMREDKSAVEALNILQNMLTKVEWIRLVGLVRNVKHPNQYSTSGACPWPVVCGYEAPFSDLMAHRRRLTCTTGVLASYPVRI